MEKIQVKELARELAKQMELCPGEKEAILAEVIRRVATSAFHAGFSQACLFGMVDVYQDPDPADILE